MGLHAENGSRITRAGFPATVIAEADPQYTVTARVYRQSRFETVSEDGTEGTKKQLAFRAGQIVRKSEIDAEFPIATIVSVLPATGTASGSTPVTIKGTNFDGVTAVSFGGTAATAVVSVNTTTVTCVTPAHAAGAVNVVVTDDSGTVTKTNGYTFT